MLSFAGTLTFGNAGYLREAAALTPVEQLLVETDAPFLTPMPHRGRPNASRLVPHTVRALAEVTGVDTRRASSAPSTVVTASRGTRGHPGFVASGGRRVPRRRDLHEQGDGRGGCPEDDNERRGSPHRRRPLHRRARPGVLLARAWWLAAGRRAVAGGSVELAEPTPEGTATLRRQAQHGRRVRRLGLLLGVAGVIGSVVLFAEASVFLWVPCSPRPAGRRAAGRGDPAAPALGRPLPPRRPRRAS